MSIFIFGIKEKDVMYLFRQRSTRIYTIASNFPSYNIWISFKNETAQNMKTWNLNEIRVEQRKR